MYTPRAAVPMTSPWLMWAEASCPHAIAVPSSHRIRGVHSFALTSRDAAASVTVDQAMAPDRGRETAVWEADIDRARVRPPTVAAARTTPSLLRKAYRPSPAMIGCSVMNQPSARAQGTAV
jgi:hypothetical protein